MANIKSAQKRIEVAKRNTERNKAKKSEIKTNIKKVEKAIAAGNVDEAKELFKNVDKKMKQAQAKNIINKNKVAKTTSRLQKAINEAQNA